MLNYVPAKEVAKKWGISQRRVAVLCNEGRIENAVRFGNMWSIPSNAKKPIDKRTLRYETQKKVQLKPFVKWVGGKGQLIEELERHIPKTTTKYAEPMVGGGAFLFYLLSNYDFESFYISDTNAELINTYTVIKERAEDLIENLKKMQGDFLSLDEENRKSYYYEMRKNFNSLPLSKDTRVQKAALFIFLNKTCFNGLYRVNKKGAFNVPMGTYKNPTVCDENNLRNIAKALQRVTIVCGDYSLCENFVDDKTFAYIDPPYRPLSTTASFTSYNADGFNDDEQIRLARFVDKLHASGAKITLSNSDPQNTNPNDKFFEELYKSYTIDKVEAVRSVNSKGDNRGKIRELLIYN